MSYSLSGEIQISTVFISRILLLVNCFVSLCCTVISHLLDPRDHHKMVLIANQSYWRNLAIVGLYAMASSQYTLLCSLSHYNWDTNSQTQLFAHTGGHEFHPFTFLCTDCSHGLLIEEPVHLVYSWVMVHNSIPLSLVT